MSTCLMHSNLSTAKHWENFHDFSILPQKFFFKFGTEVLWYANLTYAKNQISISGEKKLLSATK